MQDNEGYARRYIDRQNKDRSSGYSSKANHISIITNQNKQKDVLLWHQRSRDSKLKTKESSLSNLRIQTNSKCSNTVTHLKGHRKQLSKPFIESRNSSSQAKYTTRKHSGLSSDVNTASVTLRKLQQHTIPVVNTENCMPSKTEKNEANCLTLIYQRVNTILQSYKKKQLQWKKEKQTYEKKIALLVNQLAKTERLR